MIPKLRNPMVVVILLLSIFPSALALALPMEAFPYNVNRTFYEHKWLDEFCHGVLFFALTCFIYVGFKINKFRLTTGMVGLAFATEGMQWLTGRSPSMADVYADAAGVLVFWLVLATINEQRMEAGKNKL